MTTSSCRCYFMVLLIVLQIVQFLPYSIAFQLNTWHTPILANRHQFQQQIKQNKQSYGRRTLPSLAVHQRLKPHSCMSRDIRRRRMGQYRLYASVGGRNGNNKNDDEEEITNEVIKNNRRVRSGDSRLVKNPYDGMTPYEILGVPVDADKATIKSAHRKAVLTWHPDKFFQDTEEKKAEATARMEKINRAYYILEDPDRRARYDKYGEEGVGSGASEEILRQQGGPNPFGSFFGGGGGDTVDISDLFENIFGGGSAVGGGGFGGFTGGGRMRNPKGPQPGEDVEANVDIEFLKAIFGGSEKVTVRRLDECSSCHGTGFKNTVYMGQSSCKSCKGQGIINEVQRTPFGVMSNTVVCRTCKGSGENRDDYCTRCDGNGITPESTEVSIKIPRGINTGATLRIRGQGHMGRRCGAVVSNSGKGSKKGFSDNSSGTKERGDLYIHINTLNHSKFQRDNLDIYSDETISYIDAILGKTIRAETVDGVVEVKVPPGIQPDQKLRLRGRGVYKLNSDNQRGDAFIKVKVKIPTKIDEKEKELIQQIAALHDPNVIVKENHQTKGKKTKMEDAMNTSNDQHIDSNDETSSSSSKDVQSKSSESNEDE